MAVSFSSTAFSAEDPVNITDTAGCRAIKSKSERLVCYDTVMDGDVYNEQKLKAVQAETFGSPEKKSQVDADVDALKVRIVRTQKDANKITYFQTSEGQVWKQSNRERWNLKAPFDAEITEALMGSYFLTAEGKLSTRVKRVK